MGNVYTLACLPTETTMSKTAKEPDRVSVPHLATRLQGVIEERGLVPGDRFLTTGEAARHLRVRRDLANRALQVLVHRGRIERRQRVGATVAEPGCAPPALERVHVLIQENHRSGRTVFAPAAQVGLHSALVGCDVEISVVPTGGAEEFLEPLLRRTLRGGRPEGLVLVRCDYPTQRLVRDCGLSSVVHGTTYAGIDLPSVDVDGRQMGGLQVESLLARGCERLVVLRRDRTLPGDRAFMEGLRSAASAAGHDSARITELEIAPYPDLVQAELSRLFERDETLGLICATEAFADAALASATEAGRTIGRDVWLQANDVRGARGCPPFSYLEPVEDAEAQGASLGRLLAARQADADAVPEQILIPCRLVEPSDTSASGDKR